MHRVENNPMRDHLILGSMLLGLTAFGSGCGSVEQDRIDSICNCEGCGDRELEETTIHVEADYDTADAYTCTEVLEPYWECQLQKHQCENGKYKDDNDECSAEFDQYRECLVAQSTRNNDPY